MSDAVDGRCIGQEWISVTQKYVETNLFDLNGYNTFTLKDYKLGLIVTVRPT